MRWSYVDVFCTLFSPAITEEAEDRADLGEEENESVDPEELSALLAADEEFNASLDLARIITDKLNRYVMYRI